MSIKGQAYIAGVYEHPTRKADDKSLAQLHARVMAAWQRIVTAHKDERVMIVTHGGPIRLLRAAQSGTALSALLSIDVPHGALIGIECLAG